MFLFWIEAQRKTSRSDLSFIYSAEGCGFLIRCWSHFFAKTVDLSGRSIDYPVVHDVLPSSLTSSKFT
jgi:hypothetical protein